MAVAAIVGGSGRMGGWFANFLASNGYRVIICDKKASTTRPLARVTYRSIRNESQAVQHSDIILLATPTHVTKVLLTKIASQMSRTALLIEISSIKEPVKHIVETLAGKGFQVLSIHPMFGPGAKGIRNRVVIVTHQPRHSQAAERFLSTLRKAGAEVIHSDLEEHDRIVAATLTLPHLVNFAFIETLRRAGFSLEKARTMGGTTFKLQLLVAEALFHESIHNEASILADNKSGQETFRTFVRHVHEIYGKVRTKRQTQLIRQLQSDLSYVRRDRSFRTAYERFMAAVEASVSS